MTTICAVRKLDRVAIACDTCTTYGASIETAKYVANHSKIISVGDAYVALSGPTGGKLGVSQFFGTGDTYDLSSVDSIYDTWLELHRFLKDHCFLNQQDNDDDAFESSSIEALIVSSSGIFGVSRQRAVQEFTRFYAYGRGNEYAMGAMDACYDDPVIHAEALARLGVTAAAEFNDSTALPVIVHVIDIGRVAEP